MPTTPTVGSPIRIISPNPTAPFPLSRAESIKVDADPPQDISVVVHVQKEWFQTDSEGFQIAPQQLPTITTESVGRELLLTTPQQSNLPVATNIFEVPIATADMQPLFRKQLEEMDSTTKGQWLGFLRNRRPHIVLISNHGYHGPDYPPNGPDSGGQIKYVNEKAKALALEGYKVTIVTRAFEPGAEFAQYGKRTGMAFINEHVRYVYVPGNLFSPFFSRDEVFAGISQLFPLLFSEILKQKGPVSLDIPALATLNTQIAHIYEEFFARIPKSGDKVKKDDLLAQTYSLAVALIDAIRDTIGFEAQEQKKVEASICEFLTAVFNKKGGFIPKEEIYDELPPQGRNLARFLEEETMAEHAYDLTQGLATRSPYPYENIAILESHYVDGGVLGQYIIRTWSDTICQRFLYEHFATILPQGFKDLHDFAILSNVSLVFGEYVLRAWSKETGLPKPVSQEDMLAVTVWVAERLGLPKETLRSAFENVQECSPAEVVHEAFPEELGRLILEASDKIDALAASINRANIHVFTAHSIGALKKDNYKIDRRKKGVVPGQEDPAFYDMHFFTRTAFESRLLGSERLAVTGASLLAGCTFGQGVRAFVSTSDSTSRFARLTGSNNLGNELHFPPALDLDTNRPFASVDESEVALFLRWLYDPSGVDPTHNVAETPAVMPKTLVEQLQSRPQDWNLIVECSRMDETKRKEELIRAMQSLPPNTLLLISGNKSGTVYDRLSSLIKSMGLEQRVFLLGKVPNADTLEKAYVQTRQQRVWPRTPNLMAVLTGLPFGENERQFRLVVGASASRMEGWGMALHEMMAGGYAIVSSKMVPAATTCNQQYPDAVTIVEEGSNLPSRFADAIKTLIDDPAKARFQSQDTKKFAQDYSWRKLTRRWLRDVDRVFGRQELKRLPIVPGRDHTQITIAEKRHKPLVVVLCGGVGERFKAVTGGEPKQLACVIQPDRSMLQTTVDRLTGVASRDGRFPITPDRVLLVTGQDMVARVASQLPQIPRRNIIAEPMRRNTGPAAALGLHYAQITDPNAPVVIVSADHLITPVDTFLDRIGVAIDVAEQHALMAVFGIDPGRFSAQEGTQYGWIKSGSPLDTAKGVSLVELFKEKPDNNTAQEYLSQGNFLVNSGMFVLGAGLFAKIAHSCQPQMLVALNHYFALVRSGQALPPHAIAEFYRGVSKGPFDIQFVEPTAAAGRVAVVSLGGEFDNVEPSKRVYWSDIGHPEALAKEVIDGRLDPGPEIIGQLQAMQLLPEPANRLSEPVDDDLN